MLDAPPLGCAEQARPAMLDCGQRLGRAEAQESILSGHGYSFIPSYLHLPCSSLAVHLSTCPLLLEKQPSCREVSATVPCRQESLLVSGFLDGVKISCLPRVSSLIPAHSALSGGAGLQVAGSCPDAVVLLVSSPSPSPALGTGREKKKKKGAVTQIRAGIA